MTIGVDTISTVHVSILVFLVIISENAISEPISTSNSTPLPLSISFTNSTVFSNTSSIFWSKGISIAFAWFVPSKLFATSTILEAVFLPWANTKIPIALFFFSLSESIAYRNIAIKPISSSGILISNSSSSIFLISLALSKSLRLFNTVLFIWELYTIPPSSIRSINELICIDIPIFTFLLNFLFDFCSTTFNAISTA